LKVKQQAHQWFYYSKYQSKSDDYSHIKDNYRPSHADYEKIWNSIIAVADGSRETAE
jgi:chorismate synthase